MVNASPTSPAAPDHTPDSGFSGATVIADEVIATVAGIATQGVPGVYAVGGGAARALGALREAINQTDRGQGVKVEVGERQVAVEITLVAEYPAPLQQIADEVRRTVYAAIETIVGMEVAEVRVHITGVHIPGDELDDQAVAA